MVKRRWQKLGAVEVLGQLLFLTLVVPVLRSRVKERLVRIAGVRDLNDSNLERDDVLHVASVNSEMLRELLRRLDPRVIVVNGTRIIGRETLGCTNGVFINTHAGITPRYRGVHGGYWALAEGRPDLVGTTVHLVDGGIDTGGVIAQATFDVTPDDSFVTYPFLHTAAATPMLVNAVRAALKGEVEQVAPLDDSVSTLRYHPTIWFYLWTRITKGVR
jgi:methionyl-tRNA formyltransferase